MPGGNPKTREKILTSTWRLLEATTDQEVRMSDIARDAGVSRQAVYLHFPSRADLLVATVRHIDHAKDVDTRLEKSRSAETGVERLDAFIDAWGSYIPEIHGVVRALLRMRETDDAARAAWEDRMQALRRGCEAAVDALIKDGRLSAIYGRTVATDILWTLLSIQNWEQLTFDCNWTRKKYAARMKALARTILVDERA